MKEWLDIALVLAVALYVLFGYRKSRRFHQELQQIPEEKREEFLRQKGQLGFWEAGMRRLPVPVAAVGYFLAASALLLLISYLIIGGVIIYDKW